MGSAFLLRHRAGLPTGRRAGSRASRHRSDLYWPENVILDQPFTADGLYTLRAAVAAHAGQLDIPDDQVDDLLIVAGELATNTIRHGGGAGRLRLWRDRTALHCQVSDHGPGIADLTAGRTPPKPTDMRGRGMWICRQLSDTLTIQLGNHGRGVTITAVIPLDSQPSRRTGSPGRPTA